MPAKNTTNATVLFSRDKNGEKVVNAAEYHVVQAEEINSVGSVMERLAMNVLAGKVSQHIKKAADNGTLAKSMPGDQLKNQRSALAYLLTRNPEDIREAWAEYCADRKRVTAPTLQRLHSLCKPKKEKENTRVDWKAYGLAIVQAREAGDTERLDQLVYDLAVEAGIPAEPKH